MNCLILVGEPVLTVSWWVTVMWALSLAGTHRMASGLQTRSLDPFSGPMRGLPNYFEKEDLHGIIMELRVWVDRENLSQPKTRKDFSITFK